MSGLDVGGSAAGLAGVGFGDDTGFEGAVERVISEADELEA